MCGVRKFLACLFQFLLQAMRSQTPQSDACQHCRSTLQSCLRQYRLLKKTKVGILPITGFHGELKLSARPSLKTSPYFSLLGILLATGVM